MNAADYQPPLFDSPAPPPKRRARPVTASVRYSKIKPKHRTLCDDCCQEIHKLGQGIAPLPRHATWRRKDAAGSVVLCQAHKDERQDSEQD